MGNGKPTCSAPHAHEKSSPMSAPTPGRSAVDARDSSLVYLKLDHSAMTPQNWHTVSPETSQFNYANWVTISDREISAGVSSVPSSQMIVLLSVQSQINRHRGCVPSRRLCDAECNRNWRGARHCRNMWDGTLGINGETNSSRKGLNRQVYLIYFERSARRTYDCTQYEKVSHQ